MVITVLILLLSHRSLQIILQILDGKALLWAFFFSTERFGLRWNIFKGRVWRLEDISHKMGFLFADYLEEVQFLLDGTDFLEKLQILLTYFLHLSKLFLTFQGAQQLLFLFTTRLLQLFLCHLALLQLTEKVQHLAPL